MECTSYVQSIEPNVKHNLFTLYCLAENSDYYAHTTVNIVGGDYLAYSLGGMLCCLLFYFL